MSRQAEYERRESASVADIGDLPPVKNPERKEACRRDLHRFLTTYFPRSTGLSPFSDDHHRVIGRIERCIFDGGLFTNAVYRGFAKTTISENAGIWATLYGHRRFVPIFASDAGASAGNIDSIKLELSENDLLYEDFPEVCHAIRALEGKPQRCPSQTYTNKLTKHRELTHIEWTAETIVLPTIEGSVASGAILTARGITGASRGMKYKRPDGTQQRPDFVILDDPQTDESADSAVQVSKRMSIIRKSILKLGGHHRRIAVVLNATVIQMDDLVAQLLDPKRFPSWQGERIKMVRKFADAHETLWLGDYARIRNTYDAANIDDQRRAHRAATDFYRARREQMDSGCEVSWSHCFDPEAELSAVQHAYNMLIDDGPDVFASECQNEPLPKILPDADALTAEQIAGKTNGRDRGTVPNESTRLVAFIDVQKPLLPWVVVAFEDNFTGYVVDYGTWPEQKKSYFQRKDAKQTIQSVARTSDAMIASAGLEAQIRWALDSLSAELFGREWMRDDGAAMKIERCLVDANWGESSDVVYQFCRESPHAAILLPSHGKYVGASSLPFSEYRRKRGDRVGHNWRMPNVQGRRAVRYVLFDANFYKSFAHARLGVPKGGRGCLTLFGDEPEQHKLFSEHLTAENGVKTEGRGRSVVEWKIKPTRPDNDWLDGLAGCCVAASIQGVTLSETAGPKARTPHKVKLSELQKQRKHHHARSHA